MNDRVLQQALEEEHKSTEISEDIKNKVFQSIDYLMLCKSLIELYINIPNSIIQSVADNKKIIS
jgi:hypothetical protein